LIGGVLGLVGGKFTANMLPKIHAFMRGYVQLRVGQKFIATRG